MKKMILAMAFAMATTGCVAAAAVGAVGGVTSATIGAAGRVAGAGIDAVTPEKKSDSE
jgi:hypothetical protein